MIATAVNKCTGRWKMRYGANFLYLIQSSLYLRWFDQCQSYGKNDNVLLLASFIVATLTMGNKKEQHMSIGRDRRVKGHTWVPFTYTLQARYLAFHPVEFGPVRTVGVDLLGCWIFWAANEFEIQVHPFSFPKTFSGAFQISSSWRQNVVPSSSFLAGGASQSIIAWYVHDAEREQECWERQDRLVGDKRGRRLSYH